MGTASKPNSSAGRYEWERRERIMKRLGLILYSVESGEPIGTLWDETTGKHGILSERRIASILMSAYPEDPKILGHVTGDITRTLSPVLYKWRNDGCPGAEDAGFDPLFVVMAHGVAAHVVLAHGQ